MSTCKLISRRIIAAFVIIFLVASAAQANVKLSKLFSDHMVLQRDKSVPVFGTAEADEKVTVSFGGQSLSTKASVNGNWQVELAAMPANAKSQIMTVSGANKIVIRDVLVGDVWLCSGQSNMEWRLGSCDRKVDIDSADFEGIRHFAVPITSSVEPLSTVSDELKWEVCSPQTAAGFSAVSFYFARKIYEQQKDNVPIGLLLSSVGGTKIDSWLAPQGVYDDPVLRGLLGSHPTATGVFPLYNGMIHPLAPYGIRGAIWYQGESGEVEVQSQDSYYLKMKALINGWKRVWAMDEFPFYFVLISNYGNLIETDTPIFHSGGWDADTRLQQVNAMSLPDAGCASALDLGVSEVSWPGYHPKNKLDVGERLALWALKNEYGQSNIVVSGPILRDVSLSGSDVICSFDHVGGGLMVGRKIWYQPTIEVVNGELDRFVIAGADEKWYPAVAKIKGDKVILSSPSVSEPVKVSYACWQNPEGCNLYNRDGLPASPFHVEDVSVHYSITAKAGPGGTISQAGTKQFLQRMTTVYEMTPKRGYYVKDVKVDGVSVGSVSHYTFDPIYKDHTISAEFTRRKPKFNVAAAASRGGKISPAGSVEVSQGGAAAFSILPDAGNITKLVVDGVDIGEMNSFTFSNINSDHSIEAFFKCTINVSAGFGGTIEPSNTMAIEYDKSQTFKITPIDGYSIASVKVDGVDVGKVDSYEFSKIDKSHSIDVKFSKDGGTAAAVGRIPRPEELIFACMASSLPANGVCESWSSSMPTEQSFEARGLVDVKVIDSKKYADIVRDKAPSFRIGIYEEPIACNGASVVVVARPVRNGARSGWTSLVDVFYDQLVLGIHGDSGLVCVRIGGELVNSNKPIPDGQITILSLVVQPVGSYKVFANGVEIMSGNAGVDMTSLVPGAGGRGFAKEITMARNAPDAWTAFNGQMGDVFLYKTALTEVERKELETLIANQLSVP